MQDYDGYIRLTVSKDEFLKSFPRDCEFVRVEQLENDIYAIQFSYEWDFDEDLTNLLEYDFYIRDLETDAAYINKNYADLRQKYILAEFVDELMLLDKDQALEIVKMLDEKVQSW